MKKTNNTNSFFCQPACSKFASLKGGSYFVDLSSCHSLWISSKLLMPALSPPSAWMWQLNSCAWVTEMKCAVQERSGVKVIAKCILFSGWHYCCFLLEQLLGVWNTEIIKLDLGLCYVIPQGLLHQTELSREKGTHQCIQPVSALL